MVYSSLAAAFGPLISSLTIKDAEEGSGEENDYSIAFYAYDACLLVALLISLKLKVTMNATDNSDGDKKQKKKENRQEIRELFNSSALIFFAIIFQGGLMWGVRDTYLFIYLQEELKASSQLLGNQKFGSGSAFQISDFFIIQFLGFECEFEKKLIRIQIFIDYFFSLRQYICCCIWSTCPSIRQMDH